MDAHAPAAFSDLQLRSPGTAAEWERYYDLRWQMLRAPWEQPRGSEKDDIEAESVHLALWDRSGVPVAVGRLHQNSATEAQVRFMAVEPARSRQGLGSRVLSELENRARQLGATLMVLNSREQAQAFYRRHGYEASGEAGTLFGAVLHVRMVKRL
jgi:ribosomal protein S18 acetylase RimI-like enzyme